MKATDLFRPKISLKKKKKKEGKNKNRKADMYGLREKTF